MTRSCDLAHRYPALFPTDDAGPAGRYADQSSPSPQSLYAATPSAQAEDGGTVEIDWPDGTRATWFLTIQQLDGLSAFLEQALKPADSVKA